MHAIYFDPTNCVHLFANLFLFLFLALFLMDRAANDYGAGHEKPTALPRDGYPARHAACVVTFTHPPALPMRHRLMVQKTDQTTPPPPQCLCLLNHTETLKTHPSSIFLWSMKVIILISHMSPMSLWTSDKILRNFLKRVTVRINGFGPCLYSAGCLFRKCASWFAFFQFAFLLCPRQVGLT